MPLKNRKNNRCPHLDDSNRISWEEYETTDADVRDGLPPEEYIRRMRNKDRNEAVDSRGLFGSKCVQ